jgi:hypothetical protein
VIASALFSLRRCLLRGHTLRPRRELPRVCYSVHLQKKLCHVASRQAAHPRRQRAGPPRILSLCSLLAGSHRVSRSKKSEYRLVGRRRGCVRAWMIRAQSMPRIAGRASCLRTSSFRAEPYHLERPIELRIGMHLGRAHIACARVFRAQIAGSANVRLASMLWRCAMGALRVRTTSSLGPTYRT